MQPSAPPHLARLGLGWLPIGAGASGTWPKPLTRTHALFRPHPPGSHLVGSKGFGLRLAAVQDVPCLTAPRWSVGILGRALGTSGSEAGRQVGTLGGRPHDVHAVTGKGATWRGAAASVDAQGHSVITSRRLHQHHPTVARSRSKQRAHAPGCGGAGTWPPTSPVLQTFSSNWSRS